MMTLFLVIAAVLLGSAVGVVVLRSPIHCALSLFVHLMSVAAVFAMLHAHFLMVAQIIVYAGAIVVLVLFVIMLLNVQAESRRAVGYPHLAAGGIAAAIFLFIAAPLLSDAFSGIGNTGVSIEGTVKAVGSLLYTRYVFLVQAAGILLLAATVGAVMVARKTKRTANTSTGGEA